MARKPRVGAQAQGWLPLPPGGGGVAQGALSRGLQAFSIATMLLGQTTCTAAAICPRALQEGPGPSISVAEREGTPKLRSQAADRCYLH